MKKSLESTRKELASIRTGRATTSLLDTVHVLYYGNSTPLSQVATVSAPEPRLLVIQPWEKNMVTEISRAIQKSDLGLNPTDDGSVVRVPIPSLTEEQQDMVAHRQARRGGPRHIRQVRRDANDELKKRLKAHEIPQDDEKRAEQDIRRPRRDRRDRRELLKKTSEIMEV
jgi:ribosome recycling factor